MGHMTTVTVLNDGMDQIEKYPDQLIEAINKGMNGEHPWNPTGKLNCNTYGAGNHGNCIIVSKAHHADDPRLYLVHQNMMVPLGLMNSGDVRNLDLRKQLLETAKDLIRREEREIKKLEEKQNEPS